MKTSKGDFELFRKEVLNRIDQLGLFDWRVDIVHKEHEKGSRSSINFQSENRVAVIYLTPDWRLDIVTRAELLNSAFHEVLHLLLADFFVLAHSRFVNDSEGLVKLEEAVIVRLVNAFGN